LRVVDEHIDPAKRVDRVRDSGVDACTIGDVTLNERRLCAQRFGFTHDLLTRFFVEVGDNTACTFGRKCENDSAAHSLACAGDDGNFSV
jgi:hypothetical protein